MSACLYCVNVCVYKGAHRDYACVLVCVHVCVCVNIGSVECTHILCSVCECALNESDKGRYFEAREH